MTEAEKKQYNLMLRSAMLKQRNEGMRLRKMDLPDDVIDYIETCVAIGDLFHNSSALHNGTLDYDWVKRMLDNNPQLEELKLLAEDA